MPVNAQEDDGFREIQLNGKQLVFLVMAATTVLAVSFMLGMLVGRGVRAEREEAATLQTQEAVPPTPERRTPSETVAGNPYQTVPPDPAEDEPPVAVKRSDSSAITQPAASTGTQAEKPVPSQDQNPVGQNAAAQSATAASVKPAPTQAAPQVAKAPAPAPAPVVTKPPAQPMGSGPGSGYAVQVAAVNDRGEADAIVKRLSGKGYAAYVETPKGDTAVYRVRVGTFETRRDAQSVADRLTREERFKPWVTR